MPGKGREVRTGRKQILQVYTTEMNNNKVVIYSAAWRAGAGWFVSALASAIAEAGTAVTLIAPLSEPPERDPIESGLVQRVILPRGAGGVGWVGYRALRSGRRILASFAALVRARGSNSVYMITFWDWLLTGFFQLLLLRLLGARVVYVVHDVKPHAWAFPAGLRWAEVAMLRGSFFLPSHIVTLTRAAKRQLVDEFGISDRRVSVIPHGAFETPAMPELSGNTKLLLLGAMRRNKHVLEAIQAMSQLPTDCPAQLFVAGSIHTEDPAYWSICSTAVSQGGERIHTETGFLPEERVRELLSECDAVLLPYEEFNSQSGVAILAGFAGRSLIATDVGGIGELMADGVSITRIAQPVTSETIAAAVVAYCGRDLAERRADARNTKELLTDMLSWTKIGQAYSTLLQEIR